MAKSWRPFSTTIIYNIKSIAYTNLEKMAETPNFWMNNYAERTRLEKTVCPKAARACPNPRRLDILRTNLFLDLKFSGIVPRIIIYHF